MGWGDIERKDIPLCTEYTNLHIGSPILFFPPTNFANNPKNLESIKSASPTFFLFLGKRYCWTWQPIAYFFTYKNLGLKVENFVSLCRDFNKQAEDFGSLKDYNDYLEMVEDVIYNLSNNIDIIETNKTIQTYKEVNKEQILKNRIKPTKESLELEDMLLEERSLRAKVSKEQQILEEAEKAAKIRNKEKLIDDLMFGDEDAEKILEQHREEVLKQEKKKIVFSTGNLLNSYYIKKIYWWFFYIIFFFKLFQKLFYLFLLFY